MTNKTLHFHFYDAGAYDDAPMQRYIMCNYFSVMNGRMHVGSSQLVKAQEWPAYRAHIEKNGWLEREPFYGMAA